MPRKKRFLQNLRKILGATRGDLGHAGFGRSCPHNYDICLAFPSHKTRSLTGFRPAWQTAPLSSLNEKREKLAGAAITLRSVSRAGRGLELS
jgi:hypothetical protein